MVGQSAYLSCHFSARSVNRSGKKGAPQSPAPKTLTPDVARARVSFTCQLGRWSEKTDRALPTHKVKPRRRVRLLKSYPNVNFTGLEAAGEPENRTELGRLCVRRDHGGQGEQKGCATGGVSVGPQAAAMRLDD
jgi:hypothetical protein